MSRASAEDLVERLNSFWRERGYDAGARITEVHGGAEGVGYRVVTDLVNGLPPNFSSVDKHVADVATVPLRRLKFAKVQA